MNYLTEKQWNIDLSYNNLTTVPDGTFGNITLQSLSLDHNQIYALGNNLFKGSENSMSTLNLQFNKFTYLPTAVGQLRQMYEFRIHGNPIVEFNEDILRNISSYLSQVSYGSSSLSRWPYEMKLLSSADWITIYGIDIDTIPVDAFESLFVLNITGSTLKSLSSAMSNSKKFFQLTLQDNPHLTASGLAKGGFTNLPQFRTLYIVNCALDTLPPIFDELTNLGEIYLDGNPIKDIPENTFPRNYSSMFQLTIKNGLLSKIPATFSRLTKLMNIFLMNNKITSIDDSDFHGMGELYNLYLSGNPISNISDNAFKNLKLGFLYLDNTPLTTIPKAIRNIPRLYTLNMSNSPVECTCTGLRWMQDWDNRKDVNFIGNCSNQNRSIKDFITVEIPYCI